jgi:hypothetical protein
MKLLLIALMAATTFTGTILTIFSPTSWAQSQDLSANLIEAANCIVTSNTDAVVYDSNNNRILQSVSLQQEKSVLMNHEKGQRGLDRFFGMTVSNEGLFNGKFKSTGSAVEGNRRVSKRIINTGLIEVGDTPNKRLGILETTDNVATVRKFTAKLKILSDVGEPNIKIYLLNCTNLLN